ncbi:hypothetical protein EET67_23900 [Pseudaminobacter arsenicus]|uniref:Tetratricopeptide repeat protein n=1 Tax=Borborobacter arsenicus TaxID=1851146 RepID=A0A432UZI3_9HYPH|nr:hypothetical protein [Pseudaminobacter arsenicus]RUM95323.1 hypothetical protein EET67_23900 [Pseudaminobacter arsenicus]
MRRVRFSPSTISALLAVLLGLGLVGYAAAEDGSQEPRPDFSAAWAAQLNSCAVLDALCIFQAHERLAADSSQLVPDNNNWRVALLMLRDQDEEVYLKADTLVAARIAASTDPIETLGFINSRGFSLFQGGRTEAAMKTLRQAASLALEQPPSKEREDKIASIVASMVLIPALMPEAVDLTRQIQFPDQRLTALCDIALAYARIPDADAANRVYAEIMAQLMDPPEMPTWRSRLSVRVALKGGKRESEVDTLIRRWESNPGGTGDPWASDTEETEDFLDDLKSMKREMVIARGGFPSQGTPIEPRWLMGPIYLVVSELVEAGQFDIAEQYFQSWTATKDEDDYVTYYANIAQAHMTRGEYDQVLPAIKAMFENALKEQAARDSPRKRPLRIGAVLADAVVHRQELGLDDSTAKTLQSAACETLNSPMRWAVPALRTAPTEWVESFYDKPATLIRSTLESLFKSNCNELWLGWVADPRLAEYASDSLIGALTELRRQESQRRKPAPVVGQER